MLKDGSDSVGALGALNRVYLNIGLFSEEWLLHFNALVGGKPITPIEIAVADKNSAYWEATEAQTPDMALFFLKSTAPHQLKDAPGGDAYLTKDKAEARRAARWSSPSAARAATPARFPTARRRSTPARLRRQRLPGLLEPVLGLDQDRRLQDEDARDRPGRDFLDGNYLSTDLRVPVTLLQTNACSPLATNAIAGNIWDNFSSQTYKDLPSVGTDHRGISPITGEARTYSMPAGGRGYTRPASLISVWSTAPFLLNNSVGKFNPSPSVDARMESFQDSIEQMLWPEKRDKDSVLGDKVPGVIDRTTQTSYLRVPAGYLPDLLRPLLGPRQRFVPWLFGDDGVEIGPIPAGTPVDLLANLDMLGETDGVGTTSSRIRRRCWSCC